MTGADLAADRPLALVCSVALEAEPLISRIEAAVPLTVGTKPAVSGRLAGRHIILLTAGMGKTNAAHALTALLERHPVSGVLGFGVAGAYPGSGLEPGAVALATTEIYGDEGVEAPQGWLSTEGIGIPLVEQGERLLFNEFPLDPAALRRAADALRAADVPFAAGAFVTLSTGSGTAARGSELVDRFGAICETMEGAAYAHVAALYATPFVEIRGISNAVEDRDLSRWRLRDAAAAAARAAGAAVPALASES
jgi:futalosine hydrolase